MMKIKNIFNMGCHRHPQVISGNKVWPKDIISLSMHTFLGWTPLKHIGTPGISTNLSNSQVGHYKFNSQGLKLTLSPLSPFKPGSPGSPEFPVAPLSPRGPSSPCVPGGPCDVKNQSVQNLVNNLHLNYQQHFISYGGKNKWHAGKIAPTHVKKEKKRIQGQLTR